MRNYLPARFLRTPPSVRDRPPPALRPWQARALGFDVSLFKRLSDAHPAAVTSLTRQYRMQLAIMGLANDLVYADRLVCGAPDVACRALLAAPPDAALAGWLGAAGPAKRGVGRWMAEALSPARAVVLLDTAAVSVRAGAGAGAAEGGAGAGAGAGGGQRSGEGCTMNSAEALAAALLADALARCGVAQGAIGVISPYRAQAPNPYPLPHEP